MDAIGSLIVQTSTASGALPVSGAQVYVYTHADQGGAPRLLAVKTTNESGATDIFSLPTVPKADSLTPPTADTPPPYAVYTVEVLAEGYKSKTADRVPIYEGITSLQPMILEPI